jgi:hypothetical protein
MNSIPQTKNALVIRTDFSDDEAWQAIGEDVQAPTEDDEFVANVDLLDDPALRGLSKDQLLELLPEDYPHSFLMIVDEITVRDPENPLLIVDLYDDRGREFRAVPSAVQSIENNLSISNMDFYEFADAVDEDGVFRGF